MMWTDHGRTCWFTATFSCTYLGVRRHTPWY